MRQAALARAAAEEDDKGGDGETVVDGVGGEGEGFG